MSRREVGSIPAALSVRSLHTTTLPKQAMHGRRGEGIQEAAAKFVQRIGNPHDGHLGHQVARQFHKASGAWNVAVSRPHSKAEAGKIGDDDLLAVSVPCALRDGPKLDTTFWLPPPSLHCLLQLRSPNIRAGLRETGQQGMKASGNSRLMRMPRSSRAEGSPFLADGHPVGHCD